MNRYKFYQPVLPRYRQRSVSLGVEEIQCPNWAVREFVSDSDADLYARQVFGPRAFAQKEEQTKMGRKVI